MSKGKIYRLTATSYGNAINSAGEVLSIKISTSTTVEKYSPSTGTATTVLTSTIGAGSIFVDSADNLFVVGDGSAANKHKVAIYPAATETKYGQSLTANSLKVIAGSAGSGMLGDGGQATSAQLNSPSSVTVGPDGTLYIGDRSNAKIRTVSP
ncbi:NHL repeat protein [compost metagenome]